MEKLKIVPMIMISKPFHDFVSKFEGNAKIAIRISLDISI